jgi:hypothetical protein
MTSGDSAIGGETDAEVQLHSKLFTWCHDSKTLVFDLKPINCLRHKHFLAPPIAHKPRHTLIGAFLGLRAPGERVAISRCAIFCEICTYNPSFW